MRVELAEPTRFARLLAQRYSLAAAPDVRGVSIDSRRVQAGDLFLPIVGSHNDGHDFISPAVAAGAVAVMIQHPVAALPAGVAVIEVHDVVREMGALAQAWRDQFSIPVVAITGSNGKTTTKNLALAVLAQKFRVLGTESSLNSTIGLPLTLFRLGPAHQLAVLELGSNRPGEIAYLAGLARPAVGLITNVSATHLDQLIDQAGVAREKAALFGALTDLGTAVVNLDDGAVAAMPTAARRFTYSLQAQADVMGRHEVSNNLGRLVIDPILDIRLPQPGTILARNALAATALGLLLEVPPAVIKAAIEAFALPAGRGEIIQFDDITVIDDSYNANLASTLEGLENLQQFPSRGRRIAVLGDMLELGRHSEEFHRQVGAFAASRGIDALLCFGPETRATYCTAVSGGLEAKHFTDRSELALSLSRSLSSGDVVYVKGSRGMAMDAVIREVFSR